MIKVIIPPLKRKKITKFVFVVQSIILGGIMLFPPQTFALAYSHQPQQEVNSSAGQADWPQQLRELQVNNATIFQNFNPNTVTSMVWVSHMVSTTAPESQWNKYVRSFAWTTGGTKLRLEKFGTSPNQQYRIVCDNAQSNSSCLAGQAEYWPQYAIDAYKQFNNNACPVVKIDNQCVPRVTAGSNSTNAFTLFRNTTANQATIDASNGSALYDIEIANGLVYDATWDGTKSINTKITYSDGVKCDTLNIGCWISKAWNGVEDTFTGVGNALLSGIAYLFTPDSQKTLDTFNDLNQFFSNKLGFLTYPFTFLSNFITAITNGSQWCNQTSCIKDFGTLFGSSFVVDFNTFKNKMPSLYTYITLFIQGTTIVTLLFAIRSKYVNILRN